MLLFSCLDVPTRVSRMKSVFHWREKDLRVIITAVVVLHQFCSALTTTYRSAQLVAAENKSHTTSSLFAYCVKLSLCVLSSALT